jgi:Flp pilus assembly protein TadG
MMRKLDQRGDGAMEFCLVGLPLFILMFAIFDLGRYAITMQSLRTLANAGTRATMIQCYTPAAIARTSPSGCTGSYMSNTDMQNAAPFLYGNGGGTPTLSTAGGAAALTVTASQPGFNMIMPIWGTALNAPSASTEIPF